MALESGSDKIVCPKCGFQQYKRSAICKKCGLIFDKWREMQAKKQKAERAELTSSESEPGEATRVNPLVVLAVVLAMAVAAYSFVVKGGPKPAPAPAPAPPQTSAGPGAPPPPGSPGTAPGAPEQRPGIQRFSTPGTTAPPTTAVAPAGPAATGREAEFERYENYKRDLAQALQVLAAFEKKLKDGVDFKTMRQDFLDTRTAVARAFKEPPNEGWVSYRAVEKALDAYSDSLKFWEYRVYSADYRNKLWCPGDTCPFPTEQDFKEAVGSYVNLAWDKAHAFRALAERYLQYGDALSLEIDPAAKQELADGYKDVEDIWKRLGRAG